MSKQPNNKNFFALGVIVLSLALSGAVSAGAEDELATQLTPKLRDLLRREMLAINDASQDIVAALVAGDDRRVGILAQQIHDSFIMRRSLTPEDKQDLLAVVSAEFQQLDHGLHETAAELSRAASRGDRPMQLEKFGQMIGQCRECHARYAANRFPGFAD